MKIHVITDEKGNVVATIHGSAGSHGNQPVGKPIPLSGQKLHEIELPKELEEVKNAEQLHKKLKEYLH
jgi:hypothetical protein